MLLVAIFSMVFGTIVDRHRKHLVMMFAGVVTLVSFGIAGSLYLLFPESALLDLGGPWFWIFSGIILFGAVIENMRNIALSTTVTLLVPEERHANANGMVGTVQGLAFLVTSVFSGLSIGLLGMGWTLLIAIVMSAAGAAAPLLPPHPRRPARARVRARPRSSTSVAAHRRARSDGSLRADHLLDVQQLHRRCLHGADGSLRTRAVPRRDLGHRARRHVDRLHHRRPADRQVRSRPQPDPHDAAAGHRDGRCSARCSRSASSGGSTRSASCCT